jgi:hypothetical protein
MSTSAPTTTKESYSSVNHSATTNANANTNTNIPADDGKLFWGVMSNEGSVLANLIHASHGDASRLTLRVLRKLAFSAPLTKDHREFLALDFCRVRVNWLDQLFLKEHGCGTANVPMSYKVSGSDVKTWRKLSHQQQQEILAQEAAAAAALEALEAAAEAFEVEARTRERAPPSRSVSEQCGPRSSSPEHPEKPQPYQIKSTVKVKEEQEQVLRKAIDDTETSILSDKSSVERLKTELDAQLQNQPLSTVTASQQDRLFAMEERMVSRLDRMINLEERMISRLDRMIAKLDSSTTTTVDLTGAPSTDNVEYVYPALRSNSRGRSRSRGDRVSSFILALSAQ